jgi:type II secretory pathway pseudopilin PulG
MSLKRHTATVLVPRRRKLACGIVLNQRPHERVLETLIVIAMVAILATLAIQGYRPALEKTRMVEAANLINGFRPDVVEYLAVYGKLPDTLERDEEIFGRAGKYFNRIDWQQHEIVFDLDDAIEDRFRADSLRTETSADRAQLSFRVASSPDGGRQIFLCGHAPAPEGFAAEATQHTNVDEAFLPFFCRS